MTASVAVRTSQHRVVFDGQSLNLLPGPLNGGFPAALMAGRGIPWSNPSIGSTPWDSLFARAPQDVWPYGTKSTTAVLVMNGGTSDIQIQNNDGATFYADQKNYAVAARAAGFDKIITVTLVPSSGMSAGQNTNRANGNTLLLANADGAFDAVVDLAADSRLANAADTTYYSDGIHWTGTGAGVAASLMSPVLTSILAAL